MKRTPHHTYQILTKRAERLAEIAPALSWPANVWQGVTVENRAAACRIDLLRDVPAAVKFISFEPLLEDVGTVDLTGIDWVIVGGESGAGAQSMSEKLTENLIRRAENETWNATSNFFVQTRSECPGAAG